MSPYPNYTFRRTFSSSSGVLGGLLLLFSLLVPGFGSAATSYKVTSSYGAGPYNVNQSVTFHIAAMNGAVTDLAYTGSVSIGLYASAAPNALSDSLAVYDTIPPSAPQTGIGVFNFTSGGLDISLTFKTGSPAEQLLTQEIGGTGLFNIYPGPGTVFQSFTAFNVTGYLSQYFLKDANGDNAPVSYFSPGGPTDDLTANQASVSGPSQAATITYDPSTLPTNLTTANTYAVTGVNGSYAGNGGVSIHLVVGMTNNTPTRVYYAVILDYDGSLSDYGNPVTTQDSVFFGSVTLFTPSYNAATVIGQYSGSAGLAGNTMNNGKVIVRLWTTSSSTGTDPVSISYQAPASLVSNLSYIQIPFSPSNIQPVKAVMNPTVFEAGNSASVTMTIQNLSGSPVSTLSYKVPANPAGGTDWDLPTFPATLVGHTGSTIIYQAPSGTTDGSFTVSMFGGDAVTVNESITIGMQGTASSIGGGSLWGFNLMGVTSTTSLSLPTDSSGATVTTYGVPSASSGVTASPSNFNGGGNQVSLNWGPVTNEGANGYVIYRESPPGGGFSAVMTLAGTSWTDSGVTNLSNYDYSVRATNSVTIGGPVTSNSVIPFANPSPPTPVAALTGGTTVQVNWTAATAGSYALAGYQIWRDTQPSMATAVSLTTVGATTITYNDTTVSPGPASFYYYGIAAVDNQYASGAPGSAHIASLTAPVTGNPSGFPPTGLTAALTPTPLTLHLSWTPPINVLNALTNYYVWRGVNGAAPSAYVTVAASPTTFDDAAVTAGSNYSYEVFGVQGAGVTSNPSNAVTGFVGPVAPASLSKFSSSASITLTWPKVADSLGETIVSYVLKRASSGVTTSFGPIVSATNPITYLDSTPLDGTDYAYMVAAIDQNAVTGAFSSAVTAATWPQIPQNLVGTYDPASNSVTLTWATPTPTETNLAANGSFQLEVKPSSSGFVPTITPIPATNPTKVYSFVPADAGVTYHFDVFAQNLYGGPSPGTSTAYVIIIPPNTPATPSAVASSGSITLTWTGNPGSEGVTGYAVYRDSGSGFVSIGTSASATYIDSTGLLTGVNYVYKIKAINTGGSSFNYSGSVTWGLGPTVPTGLAITSIDTGNNIGVAWNAVTLANANATAVSLYVTTSNASPFGGVTVQFTPASTSAVTDTGFLSGASGESAGTTFFYWLQTVNPYGNSSPASGGPVSKLTYPGAPNLAPIVLAPDGVSRILNWTLAPSGSVTQYLIYREISGSGNWINTHSLAASGLVLPVTLTSAIQPGQTYDYKVVAVNPTGNGPDSNIRTFSSLPSAPVSVTAVSGVSPSADQVDLAWSDPATIIAAQGVTAFTIYRSPSNATTATYTALVTVGSGTFNYSDTTVSDLTTYYYLITATSTVPLESYLSTTNAVAVTTFQAPNPPTSPVATAATGSVSVAWTGAPATSYPVSVYILNRTANGVSLAPVTVASPATMLNNTSLTNGVTYAYTIQTEDNQGHLSASAGPVQDIPLAIPGPPLNPNAVTGDTKLLLTWNPATQGTLPIGGYQIFSITGPVTTLIYTAPATLNSYLVSGLTNGNTYTFVMNTLDNSGVTTGLHVSSYTAAFSGSPITSQVNPPSNLSALAGNAQVLLSWTDSVTIAAPVTAYVVNQSSSGLGGTFSAVVTVAATGAVNQSVTQTGLTNGTNYAYYLVAMDNLRNFASHSATVTGIPASPPAAPASLTGTDGNNQVVLQWAPSPAQGSITILGYYVIQNITAGSPVTFFTSGPVTTYTDSTVSNGQSVTYAVGAINSNGTPGLPTAPILDYPYGAFAPTITGHSSSATAVTLTFNPPGAPSWPVTQYDFLRTTVSSGATVLIPAGAASPVVDTTAVLGTLYSYGLVALDNKGHMSAASNAVTDGAANTPAGPATILLVPGSQQVLIDWPAPVSVAGSLPVSEYILNVNGTPVTLPASQTWYLDSGLTDPQGVTVSIAVLDASGQFTTNHSVTLSATAPVTTSPNNINPPTGLTATALSASSIQLVWNAPNDLGYPVTAFKVYRSSLFISTPGAAITQIASPPSAFGPVTTFTDIGLSASTTYFYVVQAVYGAVPSGAASNTSPASNNAIAKTVTPLVPPPPVQGNMYFDANVLLPNTGQLLNITFQAPNSGPTELDVYNVSGNPVRALYTTAVGGSSVSLTWDGKDRNGKTVASGLYLIEIKGPGIHLVRKVIVVK